jgi:hypothetical protein
MEFILLVVVGTSIWVLIDAKSIGVEKGKIKGVANMGPWGWFFSCLLLWIIAFPLYLGNRGKFKQIDSTGQAKSGDDPIALLEKLKKLRDKGTISESEFEKGKRILLEKL